MTVQFLEDCEKKKIRLFLYSEYEKTIEDFIREAPDLVAKAQSKSSQSFTQDNPKQLLEHTIAEKRYKIDRVEGKETWLDAYNYNELPLVGRENERELLDEFANHDDQFKIWAISGPSGSGKTRLACEWAYFSKEIDNWDRRVLHKEDRTDLEKWANWSPDKPTLIIIDYLYGFEDVVLKLMVRRLESTAPKIRLLLIDHIFSEPLHSDKRWGFSGDGSSLNRNKKYFFDLKPLDLKETKNQKKIIKSIIANRVGVNIEDIQVVEAHEYLLNTQGAYHPLFAALVGDAISSGEYFNIWSRRELINYYLSGNDRLPWKHVNDEGRWASHFIAVATARRGVDYVYLSEAASNFASAPEQFANVKGICQKVVTDKNTTSLKPFEPDILGESFFLEFLKFLKFTESSIYQGEFRQVFMAGNEDTQTKDAIEFIAFIQRLTRNLLNDNQNQSETIELWKILFDFMHPSRFGNAEPIKFALTAVLIDIVYAVQDQFPEEELIILLNHIEPVVLYQVHNSRLLEKALLYFMGYFELTSKITNKTFTFSEEMSALFNQYTANDIYKKRLLILASRHGFNEVVKALIDRDANIDAADNEGRTALIWASAEGRVEVVRLLLEKEANIDPADNEGFTALIWASIEGHIEVVRLLLNKRANIDPADNIEGLTALVYTIEMAMLRVNDAVDNEDGTALIWASAGSHIEVARLLLDKGARIDKGEYIDVTDNEDSTALIRASAGIHIEVVKLLFNERMAYIDTINNEDGAALVWASSGGHAEVARLLIDEGAYIDTIDNEGHTAFIRACLEGHVDVAKMLFDEGAYIDAIDNEARTGLIWACQYNHLEIVKFLLEREAQIDAVDNYEQTALSVAKEKRHTEIIELLAEHDSGD